MTAPQNLGAQHRCVKRRSDCRQPFAATYFTVNTFSPELPEYSLEPE